ncbi:Kinesin motor domain [Dillenia turbinata]|uniref:Kinesin motor domain n=1 Tax=Dillenia turbinata TaxID=194707 RepID=A0AAN8VBW8_9MAGN
MPFVSETTSSIKTRFGFQDSSSDSLPVKSTPDLIKSASKENLFQSSAIRSICNRDNRSDGVVSATTKSFEFDEDPSFWKDHNIQVIIRIRPLSSSEISQQGYNKCVRQESSQTITWIGHPESRFTFDLVADANEKLFKVAGVPMVENCVAGYNSCMFAYGQTGSGKTHTMLGDIEEGTRRHSVNCGMTPRVFEYLFSRIQKEKEARRDEKLKFTCKCSFLEIYNEQILDLLEPSSVNLQIREDTKRGVHVENLTELEVTSARDVIQHLVQGSANRKVAATNMNRASSRSHSVFTCIIESKWESQGLTHHRFARLNLVDLAGSERQKSSGAEGDRLKEATNINKSLSTLGLVIMNLVNISNGKSLHVPYRDSKLTFLLQDSLGGNSKTIMIANISPANICSLETLSTLKFAQRAKFIKNNAIVNEDASGDVLALRMEIQQLKKEVSRLRGLANGGAENQENYILAACFAGSPGSFKWEGVHGPFSPLTSGKSLSQKKDYEVALLGALRRERDKDTALQALTAENQAAMQLAVERENEIQGLKMRLRFREAGIKRLEAVASGKISAETHLLKEKEEYLKEIEVLRAQVDRNQESFCEEGERENMSEEIAILQNKLVEALEWKLMHESDPSIVQKGRLDDGYSNLYDICQDPASPWRSTTSEENEFLRLQAIQNQAEMDLLRKKLHTCLEEKKELERHVNDLLAKMDEERDSSRTMKAAEESKVRLLSLPSGYISDVALNDQMELKTMVDAIATASQREAEAHEIAINLTKENDELRLKLKVLIEDNNKLIELYERAVAENNLKEGNIAENVQTENTEERGNDFPEVAADREMVIRKEAENLERQLTEMHEENEKLLGLYEKAMQERDELKRIILSTGQTTTGGGFECPEKLVEVDMGEHDSLDEPAASAHADVSMEAELNVQSSETHVELETPTVSDDIEVLKLEKSAVSENIEVVTEETRSDDTEISSQTDALMDTERNVQGRDNHMEIEKPSVSSGTEVLIEELFSKLSLQDMSETCRKSSELNDNLTDQGDGTAELNKQSILVKERMLLEEGPLNCSMATVMEELNLIRLKLEGLQEKLSNASRTSVCRFLERAIVEVDELSKDIEVVEEGICTKKNELEALKIASFEMQERGTVVDKKLKALKHSLSSFSSSLGYFEEREARAKTRLDASSSNVSQKKEKLSQLQSQMSEIEATRKKIQQSDVELRIKLSGLKSKLEEENKRRENEKVLFAIDNLERAEIPPQNWHLAGKATELLKSEEDKIKVHNEIKQCREKLGIMVGEIEDLNRKSKQLESQMQVTDSELQKGLKSHKELELRLLSLVQEKEALLELREGGKTEIYNLILDYQQYNFEADLKEAEMKILEEEILSETRRIEGLQTARIAANEKKSQLLEDIRLTPFFLPETIEEELQLIRMSVLEAKSLLRD